MDKISEEELKRLLKSKKSKRKMKTGKKGFWTGMIISIILLIFSAVMVILDKDTQTVAIFAGAGVSIIPFNLAIYQNNSTKENLVHMEKNYIENYDQQEGIY